MTEPAEAVKLHIINAHALEPGKIYLFEIDRAKISTEEIRSVLTYLHERHDIKGVVLRSFGGDGLRVIAPETRGDNG